MKHRDPIPPCLPEKILLRFLRDDLVEEVLGDLEEKFYLTVKTKSPFKARVNYWYQVLYYMRPFAIRQVSSNRLNHYAMFRNYFKVGFRNLRTNKGYSFINIGGFAMGMAITMLIGLWIYDELSHNKYYENYDDLVQVLQHRTFNGSVNTGPAIPRPLENALRDTYGSDFKYLSMATWTGGRILAAGEKKLTKSGNYFQADFPEMLSLKMIQGTRHGLKDPASILLSESTAKAIFGNQDPMNQAVRIEDKLDVKVTGVYEDLPYNTTFNNLQFISSWELYITSQEWVKNASIQWGNNSFQLFAQFFTVSFQAVKAALMNPVKSLRSE